MMNCEQCLPTYNINLSLIEKDLKKSCRKHHQLKKELEEICQKLERNPKYGELMKYLPPLFQNKIYKIEVLGSSGFRFIYYWEEGKDITGLFLFSRKEGYPGTTEIVKRVP